MEEIKLSDPSAERAVLSGVFNFGNDAYFDVSDIITEKKFTVDSKDKKTNLRKKVNFHRLVASAFIVNDDPKTKKVVDHINELKYDYRLENLRWLSQSENSKRGNLKK